MKATYIIVKDQTKRHPTKTTYNRHDIAWHEFNKLIEEGYYPVCYIKTGLFRRAKKINWDRVTYNR